MTRPHDFIAVSAPTEQSVFATEVRAGLTAQGQKTLSPKYFYDALGSTLFEAITQLPEYGLWRVERQLLEDHAEDIAHMAEATTVIELGSGSANKTVPLLKALLRRQAVSYCTVDVSSTALEMTRRELGGLRGLALRGIEREYLPGLEAALQGRSAGRALVLFLGSSLGNFERLESQRLLRRIHRLLRPGDSLLLGADLEKPVEQLVAAYDDALGVTAAFNMNVLVRMNRELGADFQLSQFRHRAFFNEQMRDVEMHLESLCDQHIHIPAADLSVALRSGETIHTESSHKYTLRELTELADSSGFQCVAQWSNKEWPFASGLYRSL